MHKAISIISIGIIAAISLGSCTEGKEYGFGELVFFDEFDGASLDSTKWAHQTGGGSYVYPYQPGFGNGEMQFYDEANATLEGGNLVITAKREEKQEIGPTGTQYNYGYSSARITTKDLYQFTHGRVEARIKLPYGDEGLWPAFWMLGANVESVGWATCGEIDIMENGGLNPMTVHSTIHYGGNWPNNRYTGNQFNYSGADFHIYRLDWTPSSMSFYMDDHLIASYPTSTDPAFNRDFFILINIAIGGGFGDSGTPVPSNYEGDGIKMLVDWIRVYELTEL